MANINARSRFAAFDPATVGGLIKAFDDARALLPLQPPSQITLELLALKITELAQNGLTDPVRLRDEALAFLSAKPI